MAVETRELDLAGLRLSPGEGRRLELRTRIEPLALGSESYQAQPTEGQARPDGGALSGAGAPSEDEGVPVQLDVSRMNGGGYALRLRFDALAAGPCMRCLNAAAPRIEVEAREVDAPGGGEELDSPYVREETLDLAGWARDAFALALPWQILCREDCAGLCPVCAVDLNEAGPEHRHESAPDPRWAKLRELKIS
ncbi:MAG TPA: DUF177 domain-containing protein [Solirubrobacteraceae bacterium]|jgi:uncharacterized protein|nr:DUF177 domain-containing protein [Solirubrobacteraceae bacterium]